MKKLYDFNKLVTQVHAQVGEVITSELIEELLTLSEDAYQKDSPLSVGKSLTVLSLEFLGNKIHNNIEQPIDYKRRFFEGVNFWVGDNLVGKSSIFKIIKLALTGSKKMSRDVENWLTDIWLEFGLGSNKYSVHIDRDRSGRFHFMLYNGDREDINVDGEINSEKCLFDGGIGKYEEFLQTFFFRELSYYSLQWTQHHSQPDNPELLTSGASWSTYYKSVFLEAEDYNFLFYGNQAELIFQMLLGLELTYPINRLKVKRKLLANQLGITKSASKTSEQEENETQRIACQKELDETVNALSSLENESRKAVELNNMNSNNEQKLETARQSYYKAVERRGVLDMEKERLINQVSPLNRKASALMRQIEEYDVDLNKKKRRINDVQELLELGGFFSSLEVRTCPNCNHTVEKHKVVHEKNTGHCRLCESEVENQPIDEILYKEQIKTLEQQRQSLFNDQYNLKVNRAGVTDEVNKINKSIQRIEQEIERLNVDNLFNEFEYLQKSIVINQPKAFDWTAHITKVTELSSRKGELMHKLETYKPIIAVAATGNELIELQIKAIEIAETLLQEEREERSQSLIQMFENLYLKQLHSFGLPHYERVEIKPSFKVSYYMHGDEFGFDEITAGEKLRAKLGLYIALIELDVEHQLGRHPRFLVLDSPAREEGDHSYVEGLKTTLTYIQEHFGKDLQIFVGTAQRDLVVNIDPKQVEVKEQKEYFF